MTLMVLPRQNPVTPSALYIVLMHSDTLLNLPGSTIIFTKDEG